jgi:hypothetical protein
MLASRRRAARAGEGREAGSRAHHLCAIYGGDEAFTAGFLLATGLMGALASLLTQLTA